ncbi:MAG: ATP-binding cassette domain-containing protein [Longimicrobiales bacterium]
MTAVLARLDGVARRFGSVQALAGASLEVRAGEVHAVLGENGAGKSTLLSVLGGMLRPDSGTIEVGGERVEFASPRDAWKRGIGLVHQHFTLVPALSGLENLALGRRSSPFRLRRTLEGLRADAESLMDRTGLAVPLDAPVEGLGVGEKQRLEILKVLLRDPSVVVLDEPTAALAPAEVTALFALLRSLAAEARAIVLVAHKIDEVLAVADRVTVLRRGRTTLTELRANVGAEALVRAMIGDPHVYAAALGVDASASHSRPTRTRGAVVATLDDVRACAPSGRLALDGVSLEIARGEIVGIAGVEGNGQRELALILAGRLRATAGSVRLPAGIGFVPQDRSHEGLVGDFDLAENVALALHADARFGGRATLAWAAIRAEAERVRDRFAIVSAGTSTRADMLSGGNQQRLVIGREMLVASDLLVAENPTRGLDVAATAFVHSELRRLTESPAGPGVVLVSSDLDEVLSLSDRVLVAAGGRLIPVPEHARSKQGVGALMLGGARGAA